MELTSDVSAERVHFHKEQKILNDIAQEARDQAPAFAALSEEALFEKVEAILVEKIKNGDNQAYFQLGLLFFEQVSYIKCACVFVCVCGGEGADSFKGLLSCDV